MTVSDCAQFIGWKCCLHYFTYLVTTLSKRFSTEQADRIQSYAVIKHIIVHNLYGVDIEE